MAFNPWSERGVALERQVRTWPQIRRRGLDRVSAPDTLRPEEATDHGIGALRPHLGQDRAA